MMPISPADTNEIPIPIPMSYHSREARSEFFQTTSREARSEKFLDYLREPPGAKVRTFIAYYLREPPGERPTTKYEWGRQNSNFISYYLREPPGDPPNTTFNETRGPEGPGNRAPGKFAVTPTRPFAQKK